MNNANDYANHLPSKLRLALWKRIDRHLQQGEALISTEHFFRVMEQEFARLIGVRPSAKIRQALCEMIAHVNEQYSDKYMACGIHNAVKDYLARMPHQRDGGEETMEQTRQRLRRTVRDGRAGAFLESIGVEVGPTVRRRAWQRPSRRRWKSIRRWASRSSPLRSRSGVGGRDWNGSRSASRVPILLLQQRTRVR